MYAGFVRDIIPAYIPFRMFWVYFTAIAMMAACVSFVTGILSALAARLLGCMMVIFLLLIHTSILSGDPHAINWTRFFQDLSITGAAFILGSVGWRRGLGRPDGLDPGQQAASGSSGSEGRRGSQWLALAGRYLYAIPLIFLGAQHFWRVAFVTAKIPDYLPLKTVWDYLVGAFIILAALAIVLRQKARQPAMVLGTVLLLLGLLYHIPVLIANPYVATAWTAAMLDAMIAAGALMLASSQQAPG